MDKEKMNNDPQNTSEEITERIEEMTEEETETGAGTVSISDRLREAEADENDYDADVEDGYDEAEYDEADGEVDGENEYGEASEDAEYVEDEYSEEEEEEDDDDEPRIVVNPKVVKVASLILFSGIILVFASIAWFTMNRDVGTSGMGVKTAGMPFEIAAYGTEGVRNASTIISMAPEYQPGTSTTLSGTTYYATGAGTDAIRLQYSTGESEIGPGGSGVLDLFLISKVDGSLAVDIDLNVKAYATVDKYDLDANDQKIQATDENENPIFEEDGTTLVYRTTPIIVAVSDVNTTDYNISNSYLTTLQSAENYIKGHIMFFENEGQIVTTGDPGEETVVEDSSYYYTDPLINRHYEWSTNSTEVDEVHHIPIYWMWPNTLGQILLDGKYNMRSGIPLVKDVDNATEKAEMVTYLKNNKSIVFTNSADIDNSIIINHPTQTNFDLMSSGYNTADFTIGSNIDYFMIEVTVSLHSDGDSGS